MSTAEIVVLASQVIETVCALLCEALKSDPVPTAAELHARIVKALEARKADWLGKAKAEAEAGFAEAAAEAFSEG
jgi:hypothetical protein